MTHESVGDHPLENKFTRDELSPYYHTPTTLLPPRVKSGTEVLLGPRAEGDDVVDDVGVGEGERERGRSADDLTLEVVLASVARAHELVLGSVPRNDASQVRADGVDSVVLDSRVVGHQVGGVSLESLDQRAVSRLVILQPSGQLDLVSSGITSRLSSGTTSRSLGDEEEGERSGHTGSGCSG